MRASLRREPDDRAARDFNFAAHLFAANRGRAGKIAYVDDRGTLSYGELEDRVAPLRRRPARARPAPRGARAAADARLQRVAGRLPRLRSTPASFRSPSTRCSPSTTTPTCSRTAAPRRRSSRRRSSRRCGKAMARGAERSRRRVIVAAAPMRSPAATTRPARPRSISRLSSRRPSRSPRRRRRAATTPRSGSIRRARPASRRARCTPTPTPGGRPSSTARACSRLTERDVCFSAAKLYFAYGLGNALTFPLSVGASVVLMAERPTPDAVFKRWTGSAPAAGAAPAPTAADGLLRRADRLRRHARVAVPAATRRGRVAHVLVGGRGAAGRDRPALRAPLRLRHRRRHRLDRDAARLPLEPARRRPLRHDRQARSPATRSSCAARTAARSATARSATSSSRGRARR